MIEVWSAGACGGISSSQAGPLRITLAAWSQAEGEEVGLCWGCHETPLGRVFMAVAGERGLVSLAFLRPSGKATGVENPLEMRLAALARAWHSAELRRDEGAVSAYAARLECLFGQDVSLAAEWPALPVLLRGTRFQQAVWRRLAAIPWGATVSYGEIAASLGKPHAAQAVGQAVGHNPVAWFVPCHRVLGARGAPGGYAWGLPLKQALLALEGGTHQNGNTAQA